MRSVFGVADVIDTPTSVREAYRAFVARHEVAWELAFAGLAVMFVALGFIPVEPGSSADTTVFALELFLSAAFIAEFTSRLWAADSRRAHLRGHWIDLVSCIPPVRWLRGLRLLRLVRLVRAFAGVGRAITGLDRMRRHKGLIWMFVAWIAVMLICSVGLFISENGVNPNVRGPLDALWWGLTTMTTVGYGDVFPVTSEGRLAAAVLMILGIGLYSLITATVTSFLLTGDDRSSDVVGQLERLAVLHASGAVSDAEYATAKAAVIG